MGQGRETKEKIATKPGVKIKKHEVKANQLLLKQRMRKIGDRMDS